ncbi:unnamed protein product [Trifolium pratense]|uniref:Uncharacterized protein n=1 Tax=Trifolium pratense TaxID=57577 RepID=A0ACB0LFJ8_TRIPR|nr:unnamed protein product [Trifolium pratense]
MERSRSKRSYYYDQDYDSETMARTRPRYNHHYSRENSHRHRGAGGGGGGGGGGRHFKTQDSPLTVTTSYRILCHDLKAGGVIGKSGNIIKSIRQHTGAWINVHEPVGGDEERIIEISDTRRRDPEGRMPAFSPAQEALLLIHERILESDPGFGVGEEEDEYGGGGRGGGGKRVSSRLVVSKMHVGCLLGKGGKIIEQMRHETKTQIRILPRDHTLPRCVAMSEEIVQVTGDINAVKNAFIVISSRLRESQHRDRSGERGGHFHGRGHSPERFFPPDDDYIPHVTSGSRRSSVERAGFGSRVANNNSRSNNHASLAYAMDQGAAPVADDGQLFYEDLVFRVLCPVDRVDRIVGESDGIMDILLNTVGVNVKVADPVAGSDEQIVIITSEEGPNHNMFPAQEALLHIQSHIVDLDKDNIITTRLVVPSSDIECLDGENASLSEIARLAGASIQILPREELPPCVAKTDELVQIVGEIKAARDAVLEVTSRLRSYIYRDLLQRDTIPPSTPLPGVEASSSNSMATVTETATTKESGGPNTEMGKQKESGRSDDLPSGLNRTVSLVTRSILEVVIPEYAVPKLLAKSKSKLAQISELSGANVKLLEDQPDEKEKIIQISGAQEQAERAQSLLQGFILSTQEDGP